VLKTDSAEILFDGTVNKMINDGHYLYVGGDFSSVGRFSGSYIEIDKKTGAPVNRQKWPKTKGLTNAVPDGSGRLILFGKFKQIGDSNRNYLSIIDAAGNLTSFKLDIDSEVCCAVVYNGVLYIGGYFTKVNNVSRKGLAAINLTTGVLTAWDPNITNTGRPLPCRVECMLQNGGTLYIGGAFSRIGNDLRNNIGAVDLNTGTATSWAPDAFYSTNPLYGNVSKILRIGSTIYACGGFDYIGGKNHNDIAAIDLATGISSNWSPNPNSVVTGLANKGDTLYVGGAFYQISGQPRTSFAAYSASTGNLLPLIVNTKRPIRDVVYAIMPVGDTLFIGGYFDSMGNRLVKNLGAFNRFSGLPYNWSSYTNGEVRNLLLSGSKLYAGGYFYCVQIKPRNNLAVLDMDADTIINWAPNVNGEVTDINVNRRALYIGGLFTKVDDSARIYNAALDIASKKILSWNPKANSAVKTIRSYKDQLYIGGSFDTVDGKARYGLARLDTTGNLHPWIGIDDTNGKVNTLEIFEDSLYVGGHFVYLGGKQISHLGAINLKTGLATSFNAAKRKDSVRYVYNTFLFKDTLYTAQIYNRPLSPVDTDKFLPVNLVHAYTLSDGKWIQWDNNPEYNFDIEELSVTSIDNVLHMYVVGLFDIIRSKKLYSQKNTAIYTLPQVPPPPGPLSSELYLTSFNPSFLETGPLNTMSLYGNKLYYGGRLLNATKGYSNVALFIMPNLTLHTGIATDTNGVCAGKSTTIRINSTVTYGAKYEWYKNSLKFNNPLPYYTYTPSNGDSIYCVVTVPANGCLPDNWDTTNAIVYDVTPTVTPDINISGPTTEEAGKQVVVKATVKDAATGYTIEWFNKGVSMGKTTVDSIAYTKGTGADSIYAVITPRTDTCYVTDTSSLIKIDETPVGITSLAGDASIKVYPNPFDTYVRITGLEQGDVIQVYDVTGRKVWSRVSADKEYQLPTKEMHTGVYVLRINNKSGVDKQHLLIEKR